MHGGHMLFFCCALFVTPYNYFRMRSPSASTRSCTRLGSARHKLSTSRLSLMSCAIPLNREGGTEGGTEAGPHFTVKNGAGPKG